VQCLSYLMNLPDDERDIIVKNAYQSVKKYDIEPVVNQWIEFIHQLFNENGNTPF